MKRTLDIQEPGACSDAGLREFERLVREGFDGSDETLPDRIRAARRLAFHRSAEGALSAIAGLKAPGGEYRRAVFEKAGAAGDADDYRLELGWVYVAPEQRGRGLGEDLCRRLLAQARGCGVFATTRPDNAPMIRILLRLGFTRAGEPYPRADRDEQLVLFLLPGQHPSGAS